MRLRIKDMREDCDKTQKMIMKYLGITQATYSRYENGERQIPINLLAKLADYYGVSVDYLLGLTENPKRNY